MNNHWAARSIWVCFFGTLAANSAWAQYRVPGNLGSSWLRTGLTIRAGTLVRATATGIVNIGGGLGSYGPDGTTRFVEADGYPAFTRYRYGVVFRVTPTMHPLTEFALDWSYGEAHEFCVTTPGYLSMTANDFRPADNTGEFQVTLSLGTCGVPVTETTIRVVDDTGRSVPNAEVYLDGRVAGATNSAGTLTLPRLHGGQTLAARVLVDTRESERDAHEGGTGRGWSYRVYQTSLSPDSTGAFPFVRVGDPAVEQRVVVSNSRPLVGLNLVASVEWDAIPAEMAEIRSRLQGASSFLFNATDGQFFIERVHLLDNARLWDEADYRIYTNSSLRANVDHRGALFGTCLFCGSGYMSMSRSDNAAVFAHEFGHYGLGLGDEYEDDDSTVRCTRATAAEGGRFGYSAPLASCMMYHQDYAAKLCSLHRDNPHVGGTRQGRSSCWNTLIRMFRDTLRPGARWTFHEPATRGFLVGTIALPVTPWNTRFTTGDETNRNLCGQRTLSFVGESGPLRGARIFSRTHYDQFIIQGYTDDSGSINLSGLHIGDEIGIVWPFPGVGFGPGGPFPSSWPLSYHRITSCAADGLGRAAKAAAATSTEVIRVPAPAFPMETRLSFGATPDETLVSIRLAGPQPGPPTVRLTRLGSVAGGVIPSVYDAVAKVYVARISGLVPNRQYLIETTARDASGRTVQQAAAFVLETASSGREVFSHNGSFSFDLDKDTLPDRTLLLVSESTASAIKSGETIVAGPFSASSSLQPVLNTVSHFRFRFPRSINGLDPKTLEIRRLDNLSGNWIPMPTMVNSDLSIASTSADQLGVYMLVSKSVR